MRMARVRGVGNPRVDGRGVEKSSLKKCSELKPTLYDPIMHGCSRQSPARQSSELIVPHKQICRTPSAGTAYTTQPAFSPFRRAPPTAFLSHTSRVKPKSQPITDPNLQCKCNYGSISAQSCLSWCCVLSTHTAYFEYPAKGHSNALIVCPIRPTRRSPKVSVTHAPAPLGIPRRSFCATTPYRLLFFKIFTFATPSELLQPSLLTMWVPQQSRAARQKSSA